MFAKLKRNVARDLGTVAGKTVKTARTTGPALKNYTKSQYHTLTEAYRKANQ